MDRRSYIFSAGLHVAVILLLVVDLPWFRTPILDERVISIDIIADSSLMPSPPKPSEKAETPKPAEKPTPEPEVKQAKPEPEPKPVPQPDPKETKAAEQPEKPKEEQAPSLSNEPSKDVVQQNKPTETSKPQPKPEEQKEANVVPKPLQQPKAPTPPTDTPKPAEAKKADEAFDKLLNTLDEKEPSSSPNKQAENQMGNTLDPSERAALVDLLRRQIEQHWNKPASITEANVQLTIEFKMSPTGEVTNPEITTKQGSATPAVVDVAAQSLRRAALSASPLKFPPEMYNKYGLNTIRLTFDSGR